MTLKILLMPELLFEACRRAVVDDLFRTGFGKNCWPTWQPMVRQLLGSEPSPTSVFQLGEALSGLFLSTRGLGRAAATMEEVQGNASGAGNAWESLVCWYCNLCLIGTDTIVFKRFGDVPAPVRDALTVTYQAVQTNKESDLVAVAFPDGFSAGLKLAPGAGPLERRATLNKLAEAHFRDLRVAVIQCKTNWNENAQIPMLWDMLYKVKSFNQNDVTIGQNGFHVGGMQSFRYAFVTVPTNKVDNFGPGKLSVMRVAKLSGGNYWGRPSKSGVARSVSDIFAGALIGPGRGQGVRAALDDSLRSGGVPAYFRVGTAEAGYTLFAD